MAGHSRLATTGGARRRVVGAASHGRRFLQGWRPSSIARFNLPGIAASGLQKRDWLVVDGNIKNCLPFLIVAIGDDAGMSRAAPIGKPYLVAFFHSFVSRLSTPIAPQGRNLALAGVLPPWMIGTRFDRAKHMSALARNCSACDAN
jgi:hypothetical protein